MSGRQTVHRDAVLHVFYDPEDDVYHIEAETAGSKLSHTLGFEDAQDMACAIFRVQVGRPF